MSTDESAALVDDLAMRIREQILVGEIPLGATLRQSDLAERYGISRTPVREALRQLQSGGLITIVPNRGAVVRVPKPWEIREAYEVRAELEALAARRAATRLSAEEIEAMRESNDSLFELSQHAATSADSAASGELLSTANSFGLHAVIHRAADNVRLRQLLNDIHLSYPRNVPAMLLVENGGHRTKNHREHSEILDALATGDAALAASLMHQHVLSSGEQVARYYEVHQVD